MAIAKVFGRKVCGSAIRVGVVLFDVSLSPGILHCSCGVDGALIAFAAVDKTRNGDMGCQIVSQVHHNRQVTATDER